MKNSLRVGLAAIFIGGMILVFYYFGFRFLPFYHLGGWRFHYFGPRMWPVFPLLGMLSLIVAGILIAKYFFQALSGSSICRKDGATFCPYCGKDIKRDKNNN